MKDWWNAITHLLSRENSKEAEKSGLEEVETISEKPLSEEPKCLLQESYKRIWVDHRGREWGSKEEAIAECLVDIRFSRAASIVTVQERPYTRAAFLWILKNRDTFEKIAG